jgi:hypothetical protein
MQFRRAKMLYLQEQALRKVIAGTTADQRDDPRAGLGKKAGAPAAQ